MKRDRLNSLDLNLLRSLGYLLETGHVTRAAELAGVTQPVMSRALSRLRELFGDPLLRPVGRGLELTARARELKPRVENLVAAARLVIEPASAFTPAHARGLFRVAASEYSLFVVLTPWLRSLRTAAPGLDLHVAPADIDSLFGLADGGLDLVIGGRVPGVERAQPDRFVIKPLLEEPLVCALRPGHPALARRWTLEAFLALEHAIASFSRPGPTVIDETLAAHKLERRTALALPSVALVLAYVASSDMVCVVPRSVAAAASSPLVVRPLPFELPPLV
ncbi:MAG TPA: LysR family transcriptional regulator, partial [Polyangiales bacterium]